MTFFEPPEVGELVKKIKGIEEKKTIKDFMNALVKRKRSFLPVVDSSGRVVGAASERDLLKLIKVQPTPWMQAVVSKYIPKERLDESVSSIMTKPVTIKSDSNLDEAMKVMIANSYHSVIVVDDKEKLAGIIRFRDLMKKLLE